MAGPSYRSQLEVGTVMDGFAIGQVEESNDPRFTKGDLVEATLGWQDYAVKRGDDLVKRNASYSPEMLAGMFEGKNRGKLAVRVS